MDVYIFKKGGLLWKVVITFKKMKRNIGGIDAC